MFADYRARGDAFTAAVRRCEEGVLMATLPRENYAGTTLLVLTMTLISIGLIAISSASISLSEARFGDEWHHATRHLMYLGIGVTLGVAAYSSPSLYGVKHPPGSFCWP